MKSENIDDIDRRILAGLQRDSRQPVAELAKAAGLSPSACHRRIKLLEERHVIASYGVALDRAALGYSIELFVELSLLNQTEEALTRFEQAVLRVPEILECHLMSGEADYLLRIVARDAQDYERIHRTRIARLPGVARIVSSLALRTVKSWSGYPVG
jgi:DNA-binding Lrp family transcriptional regulator